MSPVSPVPWWPSPAEHRYVKYRSYVDVPCYPDRIDYEDVFRAARALRRGGELAHITLTLNFSSVLSDKEAYPNDVLRSEVASLGEVFNPVLEAGQVMN